MIRNKIYNKKKVFIIFIGVQLCLFGLMGRVIYLMEFKQEYYSKKAKAIQQREREIWAPRGNILDRNGEILATNKLVYTVSVIHNQIEDEKEVVDVLSKELDVSRDKIEKKVNKITSIEIIQRNVEKNIGEKIIEYNLPGVKVDEAYKRYYPYGELASKVLGFTGGDGQGILGMEVKYDKYITGINGKIKTYTDARGRELSDAKEEIILPIQGDSLKCTLDYNIQKYCQQAAETTYIKKEAESVSIIAMNPQNGEIYAMVDYPEYNLEKPFEYNGKSVKTNMDILNMMWRNRCINDTYEPGSTFKIITTAAALEENLISEKEHFYCRGYITVGDRRIRCHKTTGHGSENFVEAIENSCNPVFIELGQRIGVKRYYNYFKKFNLMEKTGIDLPGEGKTIMHKKENMGQVELATVSFGQSFQITPVRLMSTVSSLINGGKVITPHVGYSIVDCNGNEKRKFEFDAKGNICKKETSKELRKLLEMVVSEGTGNKAKVTGYEIGGKTATSQTLPRTENKYIASFLGFAPAKNPKMMVLVIIRNPSGIYYGGTIAAPVAGDIFDEILPYLSTLRNDEE